VRERESERERKREREKERERKKEREVATSHLSAFALVAVFMFFFCLFLQMLLWQFLSCYICLLNEVTVKCYCSYWGCFYVVLVAVSANAVVAVRMLLLKLL
jgi:hypothetical protein